MRSRSGDRSRAARRAVRAGIVLAVVGVLASGGDALARAAAEARAGAAIAERADPAVWRDVRVRLGGWPFTVGLLRGVVPEATVTGTVPFAVVADRLAEEAATPGTVSVSGADGLLLVGTELERATAELPVQVGIELTAVDGDLLLTPVRVDVAGQRVPITGDGPWAGLAGGLLDERRVDVGALLEEGALAAAGGALALTGAEVVDDGLRLTVTVAELPLDRDAG